MGNNYDSVDFFTDPSLIDDPYAYFEHRRAKCPVVARVLTPVKE
jgi:hypothetical protein